MSFSSMTKNELARLPIENYCCALAELAAIVRISGTIQVSGKKNLRLKFVTENAAIARRIFVLIKNLYNADIEVMVRKNKQLKKNNNYIIIVNSTETTKKILEDIGFLTDENNPFIINYKIPEKLVEKRCCKRAYIRGAFLGGGSISNPEKSYHLEFVSNNKEHSIALSNIINSFNLNSKIVMRKDNYIIYLKEGEQIVDILNIIGAHQALLKFEDIRVLKDVRNNINRLVNCETANLSKTINASLKQVNNIKLIDKKIGLENLPKNLQEIAYLRLEHRDASLKELGKMLDPPLGKSGINHRFRKIEEIADKIRKGED
mgnify:CR=1 FL=1